MRGSLRSRLVTGLALLCLLLLGAAVVGLHAGAATRRGLAAVVERLDSAEALVTALLAASADQAQAADQYAEAGAPDAVAAFRSQGDSVRQLVSSLRRLPGLAEADRARLDTVAARHAGLEAAFRQGLELRQAGRMADAAAAAAAAAATASRVVADVRTLAATHRSATVAALEQALAAARRGQLIIWLLLALGIAGAGATALAALHALHAPLRALRVATERLVEGDLRPFEPGPMPAELGALAQRIGQIAARFRGMVESMDHESRHVAERAAALATASRRLASTSGDLQSAVASMAATRQRQLQEVRDADALIGAWRESTAQDATAASQVVASRDQIASLADRQREDLAAAAQALGELREELRKGSAAARRLAQQADTVGELVDLGKQLAAQSEVLAVNAAVEAARAAEAGNGFSAIARQNRSLAEASRQAVDTVSATTTSLRDLVGTLTLALRSTGTHTIAAESAVQRMDVAATEVVRATEAMRATAGPLAESAGRNRELAKQVASLRNRLEAVTRETGTSADSAAAAAAQQAHAADETVQAATALQEAAERLAALAASVKI